MTNFKYTKVLIFLLVSFLLITTSCKKEVEKSTVSEEIQIDNYIATKKLVVTTKTAEGLRFILTKANPTGAALVKNQNVNVNYSGRFLSDKEFDTGNFTFLLGAGRVVSGFDIGIAKMRVGEKATIIFPSSLGYGDNDYSSIPGKSPLLFDIEVLSAK
jgi:FKBP-type peptidyl-prolyl cis-trans isomerase